MKVVYPATAVTVTGPLRDYASTADSVSTMHRRFCELCGARRELGNMTTIEKQARTAVLMAAETRVVLDAVCRVHGRNY